MKRSVVSGLGSYLPKRIMPNTEFEALLETSDAWIVERTGIRARHIAAEGELTSDLATHAAKAALADAGVSVDDVDLIIVATTTPDETMPATAVRVQQKLGVHKGAAFDINAACSGFVYALTVADSMVKAGQSACALVIGAETYSRIVDWKDRSTCILFGDGAGAVVLRAAKADESDRGIAFSRVFSDGTQADILKTTGGVSSTKTAGTLTMSGKEVFRHAVARMSEAVLQGLAETGIPIEKVDFLVPHQANARILASVAQKLGISERNVLSSVGEHANTSAASIPLALDVAKKAGKLRSGQILALTALGAGLTWGSCIIRW